MRLKFQTIIQVGLVSCILLTLGLSLVDVSIPPVGKYWSGVYVGGRFFLFHPLKFLDFVKFSWEKPATVYWIIQHANEVSGIFGNEEILNLVVENPWLFEFIKGMYDVDSDFLLNLGIDGLSSLLTWVIEHPQYKEILLKHPDLAKKLVENDFDERILDLKIVDVPSVELKQPSEDVFVEGTFTIKAKVTSLDVIRQVIAYVDDVPAGPLSDPDGDGFYTLTLDSTTLTEYYHNIYVKAINEQGLSNSSQVHRIKVDNFAHVVILKPVNGSTFTGQYIDVNATISDFTNWVRVYINGVPVANSTHSNKYVTTVTFRIDTSDMIFYKSTTLVTVGYESALGYTDSTLIVIYNEDV